MSETIQGSVCLNHPDVPATGRCSVCRKPICDECTVMYEGQKFCSQECKASAMRTGNLVQRMEEGKARAEQRSMIRTLIWLVILVVLASAGWYYYSNHGAEMEQQLQNVKEKAAELQKEGAKTLENAVE